MIQDVQAVRWLVQDKLVAWNKLCPKHGPCWPVCKVLSELGWGRVEFCKTKRVRTGRWYGHYVLRATDGTVIDVSGEYLDMPVSLQPAVAAPDWPLYRDFKPFAGIHDCYSPAHVAFWLACFIEAGLGSR